MRATAKLVLVGTVLLLCGLELFAQAPPARVCAVSWTGGSERLAKDLTSQPLSNGHVMEGVAVAGRNGKQIAAELKKQQCDYVLYERVEYQWRPSMGQHLGGGQHAVADTGETLQIHIYELKAWGEKRSILHGSYFPGDKRSEKNAAIAAVAKAISARQ